MNKKAKQITQQTKRKIAIGVKRSWSKRNRKKTAAALLATGAVGGIALYANRNRFAKLANKGLASADRAVAPQVEELFYDAIKNGQGLPESVKSAVKGSYRAGKELIIENTSPKVKAVVEDAKQKTTEHAKAVIDTPKKTVEAFKEGYTDAPRSLDELRQSTKKGDKAVVYLAKQNARMRVRAQQDIEKVRRFRERFGFNQNSVGLIEFTQRRKRRTAAEKAAISQGLREYYATQPKPKKSALDRIDRGAMTINRVTGVTSNILSTAGLGLSLAGQLKALTYKPSRGERIFQNTSAGAGLLASLSGSYRGFGTGTRSLASSANIYDDFRVGAKNRRFGLTEKRLNLEASKQVLAKDRAKSYRTIANTSARSNAPGGTKFEDMVTRRAKYENTDSNTIKLNLRKKPK